MRRGAVHQFDTDVDTDVDIRFDIQDDVENLDTNRSGLSAHVSLLGSQGIGAVVNSIFDSVEASSKCY